jgi:hypothetical protein
MVGWIRWSGPCGCYGWRVHAWLTPRSHTTLRMARYEAGAPETPGTNRPTVRKRPIPVSRKAAQSAGMTDAPVTGISPPARISVPAPHPPW